jgi:anti-anti-sigma regulatory factor
MPIANYLRCEPIDERALIATLVAGSYASSNERMLATLSDELRDAVSATNHSCVILDLGAPQAYGARLLGILVRLAALLRESGRRIVICGDEQNLFRATGLDRIIETYPTVSDALRAERLDSRRMEAARAVA